jgi:hypothetical protein
MLYIPVTVVILVGCCSLCCSIRSLITRDTDVAWDLPIFNINIMAVELVFCKEGVLGYEQTRAIHCHFAVIIE